MKAYVFPAPSTSTVIVQNFSGGNPFPFGNVQMDNRIILLGAAVGYPTSVLEMVKICLSGVCELVESQRCVGVWIWRSNPGGVRCKFRSVSTSELINVFLCKQLGILALPWLWMIHPAVTPFGRHFPKCRGSPALVAPDWLNSDLHALWSICSPDPSQPWLREEAEEAVADAVAAPPWCEQLRAWKCQRSKSAKCPIRTNLSPCSRHTGSLGRPSSKPTRSML